MKARIKNEIQEHIELFRKLEAGYLPKVAAIGHHLCQTLLNGKKILIAGNGGSAADAQHLAAEIVGRYLKERKAMAAIALTTDTSVVTAVANDYGYEHVFSRQLEGLSSPGDVFIGISTSGNSKNLVRAFESARSLEVDTVGLLGGNGGTMKDLADRVLIVPSDHTARIQEAHQWIYHTWCGIIEDDLG